MNPKKRKAEDDDDDSNVSKQSIERKKTESETTDVLNCGNSSDSKKSHDGGTSNQPGTSNETVLADKFKDRNDLCTDQHESKQNRLEGSNVGGTLLFSGGTNWDLIGRKELPKHAKDSVGENLLGPHQLASLSGIRVTGVFSGCSAVHSVIILEQGKVMTWGRNDKGQLGHGDIIRKDIPTLVETLKDHNIVSAACGRSHTIFLSERGIVFSSGDNKMGQCGVGSQNNVINIPTKITYKGKSIAQVACGADFSVIVDVKGLLYSFGCPEYGQLGHNSDGRYFVTSNKLSFRCELVPRRIIAFIEKTREGHVTLVDDVQITNVACGLNHTVAVDSNKRCFSWGFGGYGRLGHAEQKDEMVPRLIKVFDGPRNVHGVKKVFAGSTYSMAINALDVLFFWGQNKRAGEATMYPKPVQDLVGWHVKDVSCSYSSIVCIADESIISWGPSPTYGELAYGESRPKSSTTPQEVKPLDGIRIHSFACGHGHTLFIACDETEQDRDKISRFPEHSP